MQLDVLQRQNCVKIFCEKISGVKKRPELEHCLSLLREGDVLVVYKLDRLAVACLKLSGYARSWKVKTYGFVRSRIILIRPIIWGNLRCIFLRLWQNSNRNVIMERTREGRERAPEKRKKIRKTSGLESGNPAKSKKSDSLVSKRICCKTNMPTN